MASLINRSYLLVIVWLLSIGCCYAGTIETTTETFAGKLAVGSKIDFSEDKYKRHVDYWDNITHLSVKNSVNLRLVDSKFIQALAGTTFTVVVEVKQYNTFSGPPVVSTQTLQVNYNQTPGANYKAIQSYLFEGAFRVEATVLSITSSTYPTIADMPDVLKLSVDITVDRIYPFNAADAVSLIAKNEIDDSKQLPLHWTFEKGYQEFDIEWTTVDATGEFSTIANNMKSNIEVPTDQLDKVFRNNATRIIAQGQDYSISTIYNDNFLLVRIRHAAYDANGVRTNGNWIYKHALSAGGALTYNCWSLNWNEQKLNWQFSASFAEDGKKKEVISYFDGTLRNRQTVTINNNDKVAVIQENVYDEFGRPAASILPAPFKETGIVPYLHYQKFFNINADGNPYNITNIASTSAQDCEVLPAPLRNTSGAALYYSNNIDNPFKSLTNYGLFNQYIPDAEGYPLSVTQYTKDNTGRIRLQGGVGAAFQPGTGVTSNTTKYYYGKPSQRELDQMFGADVGYADHYTKNMVIDPNGQISLSYQNASGKTIATALSGGVPANVEGLQSSVVDADTSTIRVFKPEQFIFNSTNLKITATTSYIATVPDQQVKLKYNLQQIITHYPDPQINICSNCYYNLTITITDDCGNAISIPGLTNPVKIGVEDPAAANTPYKSEEFININFAKTGEYSIKFELAYDANVIDAYVNNFEAKGLANGYLKQKFDYIKQGFLDKMNASGCYSDCKTCLVQLADETGFKAVALKEFTDLGVKNQNAADYSTINNWIGTLYQSLKDKCIAMQSSCSYSDCDEYRRRMLADLSPGGQYGLFNGYAVLIDADKGINETNTNLLAKYFDAVFHSSGPHTEIEKDHVLLPDGTQRWIYSPEFTIANMIDNWRPEWAELFLNYHPEICKLDYCNATSIYSNWQAKVEAVVDGEGQFVLIPGAPAGMTYAENAYDLLANIDPFFAVGATGAQYKTAILSDLLNYTRNVLKITGRPNLNLYQYVKYELYCKDADVNNTSGSWPTCTPSCRVKDREWQLFRELYFRLKEKYYIKKRNDYLNANNCSCVRIIGKPYTLIPDTYGVCPPATDFRLDVTNGTPGGACYSSYPTTVRVFSITGGVAKKVMVKLSYIEGGTLKYINMLFPVGKAENVLYLPYTVSDSTITINSVTCTNVTTTLFVENIQTSSVANQIQYYREYIFPFGSSYSTENFPTTKNKIRVTLKDASGSLVVAPAGGVRIDIRYLRSVFGFHYHTPGDDYQAYSQTDAGNFYDGEDLSLIIQPGSYSTESNEYISSISNKRNDSHGHSNVVTETYTPACASYILGPVDNLSGLSFCTGSGISGGSPPACPEEAYYVNKRPIFPEYVDQEAFSTTVAATDELTNRNLEQFKAKVSESCTVGAEEWLEKLAPGLHAKYPDITEYNNIVNILKARFIAVCSTNGDLKTIAGVSALAPGVTSTMGDNNFTQIIKQQVFANGGLTAEINPWLFSGPYPYSSPKRVQSISVTNTDASICTKLNTLKTNFTATLTGGQVYTLTGFHTYLKNLYGTLVMNINEAELDDLLSSCNCSYLMKGQANLPAFLEEKGCITRAEYDSALAQMKAEFSISASALMAHANYPVILTNYMNQRWGFNLTYANYLAYTSNGLLCNDVTGDEAQADPYACLKQLLQSSLGGGLYAYLKYIEDERGKFRADYISQCSLAQNAVDLQTKAPKYQYTLYYYDQADNLVRTIPPEGVRLLANNQLQLVEQSRLTDQPVCTDAPILCNGTPVTYSTDKAAAFNQVSTVLTAGGARAFEFWLYNNTSSPNYQVIQATPDHKYMMQVAVNNGVVGFDLYPMLESADHMSVSLNPTSYQYGGTYSGGSPQPWLHVVVQGTNIAAGGVPQIYLNGTALTVSNTITAMTPGWSIQATPTGVVYPDNTATLKHMRIYSRLMTAAEIATNAADNCFKPSDACNGMSWYRFNIPVPGGETTIAENSTVETKAGALVPLHVLPTTYAYNSTNQVLMQKSPDGGINRFWYDELSRLVASQNDKQGAFNYSYTEYEKKLGRILSVGEKHMEVANYLGDPGYLSIATRDAFMLNTSNSQITKTFYDAAAPTVSGNTDGIASITGQENLRKRVAATTYQETQTGPVLQATYYNYDISGNVKTLWQQINGLTQANDINSLKRIDYEYDLVSGKVNFVAYQHNTAVPKPDQFYYKFEYDAENRLTEAWSGTSALVASLSGSTILPYSKRLDASYKYYLHGPLARMELGDQYAKVQGLDYAYTLQGWLKGVNGTHLNHAAEIGEDGTDINDFVPRDAFAFSLGYYSGDYKPIGGSANAFALKFAPGTGDATGHNLYNGNISNTTVAIDKINGGATAGYTYRYDQLNRITKTRMHSGISGTTWTAASAINDYKEDIAYDGNGNILTYNRYSNNAVNPAGGLMDQLTYRYNKTGNDLVNNRLLYIDDAAANGSANDLRDQSTGNYQYDAIGNLIADAQAGINSIDWTVYGKIKAIDKATGSDIAYTYDAGGNRVKKTVGALNTYYVRDAQGNALAVYDDAGSAVNWREQQLYGSSRLGLWQPDVNLATAGAAQSQWEKAGLKRYELSNHLGNVLATISDRRLQHATDGNQNFDYYTADVITAQDYYPFGMVQPGRTYANTSTKYRYGFNGKENDNEVKGDGNEQDYGMRIYDPRVGRFLSLDPITAKYPELTPYQFASNRPIDGIDLDGKEWATPGYFGVAVTALAQGHAKNGNPGFKDYAAAMGDMFSMAADDLADGLKNLTFDVSGARLMAKSYKDEEEYVKNEVDHIRTRGKRISEELESGGNPNDVEYNYKARQTMAALKIATDGLEYAQLSAMGADAAYAGVLATRAIITTTVKSEAEAILNGALRQEGFKTGDIIPSNFKTKFVDNGVEFEVRIHPADPKYGKTGDIYRVARRTGRGNGWEYLDNKGKWHPTSTLKPQNPTYNKKAAEQTHIQKPKKKN